jgi:hypothetical protein
MGLALRANERLEQRVLKPDFKKRRRSSSPTSCWMSAAETIPTSLEGRILGSPKVNKLNFLHTVPFRPLYGEAINPRNTLILNVLLSDCQDSGTLAPNYVTGLHALHVFICFLYFAWIQGIFFRS